MKGAFKKGGGRNCLFPFFVARRKWGGGLDVSLMLNDLYLFVNMHGNTCMHSFIHSFMPAWSLLCIFKLLADGIFVSFLLLSVLPC